MTTTVKDDPGNLILSIADMVRSKPVLDSPFVAAFTRKLQGKGPALALPLSWMEQQLAAAGTSSNDLVRQENQKQAANQVSVRNSIGTLRVIGATDWREFVENLSSVEQVLRQDLTGIYAEMDFATRDRYRHVIESLAKSSELSETEVARRALDLTKQYPGGGAGASGAAGGDAGSGDPAGGDAGSGRTAPGDAAGGDRAHGDAGSGDAAGGRERHIGYVLIDKGLRDMEKAMGIR
jgi:cyclic beta-1,2-glucan synthetase